MRTYSPVLFNSVINAPENRDTYGLPGVYLDVSNLLLDTRNHGFANEEGGFLFIYKSPGVFEVHTMFPKSANPLKAARFTREAARYMFDEVGCFVLKTQVPDDNHGASRLCDFMGFTETWHDPDAWKPGVGISYRHLTLDRWRSMCSTPREAGKASLPLRGSAVLAVKGA